MTISRLGAFLMGLQLLTGCAFLAEHSTPVAGAGGAVVMASKMDLPVAESIGGALVAYAIYDPFAPTWTVNVTQLDEDRTRLDLQMKSLITGGDGEARQVFMRNAQRLADARGVAGFDVVRYEEGIDSTRPFAHRVASGEVRFVRSRTWPGL